MSKEDAEFIIIRDNNLDFTNKILDALNIPEVDKKLNNIKKYKDFRGREEIQSNFFSRIFSSEPEKVIVQKYYYVNLRELLLPLETDLSNFVNNKKNLNKIFSCVQKINDESYLEKTGKYIEYQYIPELDENTTSPSDYGVYGRNPVQPETRFQDTYYNKVETNEKLEVKINDLLREIKNETTSHTETGGKPSQRKSIKKNRTKRKRTQKKNTKKRFRK